MEMGCRLSVCVWDAIRSTPDEGISLLAEGRNGMTGLWPHQEDRRLRFFVIFAERNAMAANLAASAPRERGINRWNNGEWWRRTPLRL